MVASRYTAQTQTLPVATSGGGDDGGSVSSANQLGIGAHRRGHDSRLRAERNAVHHPALGANAGAVAALVHFVADFVSLSFEGVKDLVALPDGAAFAGLLDLTGVAAVDRLHRRRAHRVALEKAVLADAALHAAVLPHLAVLIDLAVVNAGKRAWVRTIAVAISIVGIG